MLSAMANLSTLALVQKGIADFIQARVMPQRKKPFYLGESDSVDGGVSRLWTRPVNREDLSPGLGAVPHQARWDRSSWDFALSQIHPRMDQILGLWIIFPNAYSQVYYTETENSECLPFAAIHSPRVSVYGDSRSS